MIDELGADLLKGVDKVLGVSSRLETGENIDEKRDLVRFGIDRQRLEFAERRNGIGVDAC